MSVDWDAAVTGVSGGLALIAAVWLGRRQISIASRQADIAAEQVRISGKQNAISERQVAIMESQARLERFHAMRDDLAILLAMEEFLQDLKMNLIEKNWKELGTKVRDFRSIESRASRIVSAKAFDGLSIILDTAEFIFDTRKMQNWQMKSIIFNKSYKHHRIIMGYDVSNDERISITVNTVRAIDNILMQIKSRRTAMYEIVQPTLIPY